MQRVFVERYSRGPALLPASTPRRLLGKEDIRRPFSSTWRFTFALETSELMARSLPWIRCSGSANAVDGAWRRKRRVEAQLVAAVTCPLRRLLLTGRVGHPRRHLIRDLSLWAARGGDTRERYESVLILYARRTDRLTDRRPADFSSSISCWRSPRIPGALFIFVEGVEMRRGGSAPDDTRWPVLSVAQ